MSLAKSFDRQLDALWHRRSANLRSLIHRRRGRQGIFSKKFRTRKIHKLQALASNILLRGPARREFRRMVLHSDTNLLNRSEVRHYERILAWARETAQKHPTIYSFWRGKKCLYVGKAGRFSHRLGHYLGARSRFLSTGVKIRIFCLKRRRQLSQAECLAIHLFEPRENRVKASHKPWGKGCPICQVHDRINEELRALFKIK